MSSQPPYSNASQKRVKSTRRRWATSFARAICTHFIRNKIRKRRSRRKSTGKRRNSCMPNSHRVPRDLNNHHFWEGMNLCTSVCRISWTFSMSHVLQKLITTSRRLTAWLTSLRTWLFQPKWKNKCRYWLSCMSRSS